MGTGCKGARTLHRAREPVDCNDKLLKDVSWMHVCFQRHLLPPVSSSPSLHASAAPALPAARCCQTPLTPHPPPFSPNQTFNVLQLLHLPFYITLASSSSSSSSFPALPLLFSLITSNHSSQLAHRPAPCHARSDELEGLRTCRRPQPPLTLHALSAILLDPAGSATTPFTASTISSEERHGGWRRRSRSRTQMALTPACVGIQIACIGTYDRSLLCQGDAGGGRSRQRDMQVRITGTPLAMACAALRDAASSEKVLPPWPQDSFHPRSGWETELRQPSSSGCLTARPSCDDLLGLSWTARYSSARVTEIEGVRGGDAVAREPLGSLSGQELHLSSLPPHLREVVTSVCLLRWDPCRVSWSTLLGIPMVAL
eukprot:761230-Hanusia_phi.AAC.1